MDQQQEAGGGVLGLATAYASDDNEDTQPVCDHSTVRAAQVLCNHRLLALVPLLPATDNQYVLDMLVGCLHDHVIT